MSAPKPTAPKCIAEALAGWLGTGTSVNAGAQAVWEALLAEGQIRYAPCEPDEATMRRIVPTFDAPNDHADRWCRVLVVPLERDAQDA